MAYIKPHLISVNELYHWLQSQEVLYASDSSKSKRLVVTIGELFKVYHNNEVVLESADAADAVEFYNSI